MDRRADAAFEGLTVTTLEPVRTGRATGARAWVVTVAWLIGLAGIAGLAVVGRVNEPGDSSVTTAAELPSRRTTVSPPAATGPHRTHELVPPPGDLIVLNSPAEGAPTITTVELIVQGFLQAEAASLRVILETDGYRVDEATVVPALALGERPSATRHAQFLVRLGLPDPRPTGAMVVRVVALDREGQRLAVVRRPFQLGPIVRPTLGDDGLLGGLVFAGG